MNRFTYICNYLRENLNGTKAKKKKEAVKADPLIRKKLNKIKIEYDQYRNPILPLEISNSLTLLNLGTIEHENQSYHSEKNIFPIGFKTVREHASMFELGKRAKYTCEILRGPQGKPQFKLIPSEDPMKEIVKDSSTACWLVICHRVNDLAKNKRSRVTVSGTERFGLCDPNVIKLIQEMPNIDKCRKYTWKNLVEEDN